jgi:hypothetical protein
MATSFIYNKGIPMNAVAENLDLPPDLSNFTKEQLGCAGQMADFALQPTSFRALARSIFDPRRKGSFKKWNSAFERYIDLSFFFGRHEPFFALYEASADIVVTEKYDPKLASLMADAWIKQYNKAYSGIDAGENTESTKDLVLRRAWDDIAKASKDKKGSSVFAQKLKAAALVLPEYPAVRAALKPVAFQPK